MEELDSVINFSRVQLARARAARREFAELALAIAEVEDQVADVLVALAESGAPELADKRRGLAQSARQNAALERARAREYREHSDESRDGA